MALSASAYPLSEWRYQFTVLTPTFNRAHTLQRVFDSLCAQTFQDFEWVIVDDGSTDQTECLVRDWQKAASFPIRYFWQQNQHKKVAFNRGVQEAWGELVVALDSDDQLEPNALYDMSRTWRDIPLEERSQFAAVTGLCRTPQGIVVGDMYPYDVMDASPLDIQFVFRVGGEKFGCLSTRILRQFPFPEDINGFVPESLVWRAIARAGYKTRFVNHVYRVYYPGSDSLSEQGKQDASQHALGMWLLAHDTIVNCIPWFTASPIEFFKAAARYTRFALHLWWRSVKRPVGYRLQGGLSWALVLAMSPVGIALFLRDRWQH